MDAFAHTAQEAKLLELVAHTRPPAKHHARNAHNHIEKAWKLADVDPAMAAFRAITAEEEAATAIMQSIRRLGYPLSDSLLHRNHRHKAAVAPFFQAIEDLFAEAEVAFQTKPQLFVDESRATPRLAIRLRTGLDDPEKAFAEPQPPLHFSISRNSQAYHFEDRIAKVAALAQKKALTYIKERANLRNQILYANQQGLPEVEKVEGFLNKQRGLVTLHT